MLKLDQISLSFGPRAIFKEVSLEIKEKSLLAITGESGSGKTSLLGVVSGLLKPSQGKVTYQGKNIYKWGDLRRSRFRNKEIGFVFQFFNLFPQLTAYENILYPALINSFISSKVISKIDYLVDFLELRQIIKQYPATLSGGERQRIAIARAVINEPKIILADEPTGNLDEKTSKGIIDLFLKLKKEKGMTIIVVTHEKNLVKKSDIHYHLEDQYLEKKTKTTKKRISKKVIKDN